jgi:multiple sugar transport system permease protein
MAAAGFRSDAMTHHLLQRKTISVLLMTPALFVLLLTLILPSAWAFVLSFFQYTLGKPMLFVGLENFRKIFFEERVFWDSLLRTIAFTVLIVGGELGLGLGFSLLLARRFPLQRLWVSIIIAPMAVSEVVGIIIWKYMLAPNYGILNYMLAQSGITPPNWFVSTEAAFLAIGLIDIWLFSPFVFAIMYPSILSIDPVLHEAASIDGASYTQRIRHIILPLVKPALITTTVFRVIFALRLFAPVWLFAQGGPAGATRVLSIYLYEQAFGYYLFGLGSAVAWVLLVITLVVSRPQMRAMRRMLVDG